MKKKILLISSFLILSFYCFSQQSINITYANDSSSVNNCGATPPVWMAFTLCLNLSGYTSTDTITYQAFFGDGTSQTMAATSNPLYPWFCTSFMHTYLSLGNFDVTYIVSDNYGNSDTLFHPDEVILTNNCSNLFTNAFLDNNSNCILDAGDSVLTFLPYTLYNGTSVWANTWTLTYPNYMSIPNNVNYTAVVNTTALQQMGYTMTCPVSGMLNFTSSGSDTLNFAVICNSNFDLSISSSYHPFVIGNSALISVGINDISCNPISGSYTLNLDPQLSFVYALNPPTSGGGQIWTWNFSNLNSLTYGQGSINNMMYFNLAPGVVIGDTLCYSFNASPTAGDINVSNNTVNLCYPVVSAWDPNYKDVSPRGNGPLGEIAANTTLTYTIGFQNTGNATATDVYILDTLSINLELNSIQILYSSHPMQFYIIDGHILKFDFQNIQLPDSGANQMLSHGFVSYKIRQKPNLSNGTQIKNLAGIYFDSNPVVLTNQTLNTINITLGVSNLYNSLNQIILFPNPFNTSTTLQLSKELQSGIISIYDVLGKEVKQLKDLNGKELIIQKENLEGGMYFYRIEDKNGFVGNGKLLIQ
ncbi:MAG: T9SS type A sorting domain-containing protein [Bacteroidetes bacterium]|nr:T9SS type A sorting domain-containing protein [Bacteroidota bacterium]